MRIGIILTALLAGLTLTAAEKNLVLNGDFEMRGRSFPPFWMFRTHTPSQVDGFPDGGPDGKGFLRVAGRRAMVQVQQNNLKLVKGEKYRLSAKIRTRNLTGKKSGVTIHPGDGKGLMNLPENQAEWLAVQNEVTITVDKPHYSISIQVDAPDGVLDIAELKLTPVTRKGAAGSSTQIENITPSMVPLFLMNHVNMRRMRAEFFWVGRIPASDASDLECVFSLNGKTEKMPFSTRKIALDLAKFSPKPGSATLNLALKDKRNGRTVFTQKYSLNFRNLPELPPGRRLNNLVRVLYSDRLAAGAAVKIANPRNGWLLIRGIDGSAPTLTLDGKEVLTPAYAHHSAVRMLPAGVYTLKNKGASARVEVRAIPDIHVFPIGSSRVPGNGVYDWNFAKKYMFPALTTINEGGPGTPAEKAEAAKLGVRFLANFGVLNPEKPNDGEDMLKRLNEFKRFDDPWCRGTTMDEVEYWDAPAINPYVKALKSYRNPKDMEIRSWVIGPPSFSYADYISTACNISGGWGRVLYEVYNRQQFTEEDSRAYIRQTAQHAGFYRDIAPELFNNLSVILGNFTQAPMISLDQLPDTDFKYYLDMQMHELAVNPAYDGLGGVGFWGCHNCDEEMLRWCFALLKHYAIEGNRTMLSDRYGFKFLPGLLKNGDFEEGLKHWKVIGDVQPGYSKDYGVKSEMRYGSVYPLGDHFAILTRKAGAPTEVRQKISGLEPGKLYSVYYMVADYDDILKGINRPRRHQLQLTIPGADIIQRSYFVDTRNRPKLKERVNSCKYVFRANGPEVELVFSNRKAAPGTRLALNYITVRPYFSR